MLVQKEVEYGGFGIENHACMLVGETYYEQQCSLYANHMFLNYLLVRGGNNANGCVGCI